MSSMQEETNQGRHCLLSIIVDRVRSIDPGKCDELRPSCTRCSRLRVDCEYVATASPSTSTEISTSSPTSLGHSLAVASANNDLVKYLGTSMTQQNSDIRALRHFQDLTCDTFGGDVVNKIMRLVVSKDVWEVPYLMHMVLAVSSGHQRRLLDVHGQQQQLRTLEFAEAGHWHRGLQLYQTDLARKVQPSEGASESGFDAIVAAMLITIVFTFALEDGSAHNSRPASDNEFIARILNPMASTGGFKALQIIYDAPGSGSPWAQIFYAADDDVGSFTSDKPGVEGLPPAFVHLCELDDSSTSHDNPYHKILRHLTPLLEMKVEPENMNKIFAFGGRMHKVFRPLVMQKDVRALLILSWWLALLRQVDEWWVKAWARTSCRSVVAHLSSIQDPKIQALLVYPASFGTTDFSWIWREEG